VDITSTRLVRAAAVSAALAGAVFVAVQVGHPDPGTFTTQTTEWVVRSCAKTAMAALALAGITGMYARQHRAVGVLGLVGYLLFAVGYLGMLTVEVIAATVLPNLVGAEPGFVDDVVSAAAGGQAGDIGALQLLFNVTGVGYMVGGLLFGIALFRSGVLARWAAAMLAVSTIGTAALAVLPTSFNRPFAVPEGLALVALGWSLWRSTDEASAPVETVAAVVPVTAAGVR
jgi:hypothetical protein